MIYSLDGIDPDTKGALYIADSSRVIGRVFLDTETSVWFGAVIRGDIADIRIGEESNIQDNAVLHVDYDQPLKIGRSVTVGHGAILHACTILDETLIGMGSILLNGALINEHSIVAAGAVVSPGKTFPPRSLILGSPAKVVRELRDEEIDELIENSRRYVENAKRFSAGLDKGRS